MTYLFTYNKGMWYTHACLKITILIVSWNMKQHHNYNCMRIAFNIIETKGMDKVFYKAKLHGSMGEFLPVDKSTRTIQSHICFAISSHVEKEKWYNNNGDDRMVG